MTCLVSKSVAGPCAYCRQPMEPAHIVDDGGSTLVSCADCCPKCAALPHLEPTAGARDAEQVGLFR